MRSAVMAAQRYSAFQSHLLREVTQICSNNSKSGNSNVSDREMLKEELKLCISVVATCTRVE